MSTRDWGLHERPLRGHQRPTSAGGISATASGRLRRFHRGPANGGNRRLSAAHASIAIQQNILLNRPCRRDRATARSGVESRRLPSAPPTQRGSDGTGHWVCGRLTDHIDDRSFGRRRGPRIEPIAATKRCHRNCDRTQSTSLHLIPALAATQNCLSSPTIRSFAEWCGRPLPSILLPVAVVDGRKTEGETA
jgi:hypothetical protein